MNLNSPDSYKGVKDLNHDHILNLGEGNYMSFNHVYTITAINGNTVSVFNPHGKSAKAKTFFDKDLYQLMQDLNQLKQQLEKEYKNKGFSSDSKDAMIRIQTQLNASTFKSNFTKIINLLENITKEGLQLKGSLWIFSKKSYEKKFVAFIKVVSELLEDDLGKGFLSVYDSSLDEIKIKQNISLSIVKKYFTYIVISMIK